jgi:hypothetical protein
LIGVRTGTSGELTYNTDFIKDEFFDLLELLLASEEGFCSVEFRNEMYFRHILLPEKHLFFAHANTLNVHLHALFHLPINGSKGIMMLMRDLSCESHIRVQRFELLFR